MIEKQNILNFVSQFRRIFRTSKMKIFTKILNGFSFLIIFEKSSILDAWQDSEFVSEASN